LIFKFDIELEIENIKKDQSKKINLKRSIEIGKNKKIGKSRNRKKSN
jgi:hypothetical protein